MACCSHEIVIQTDPQNCEFVIISGARKKIQEYDDDLFLPVDEAITVSKDKLIMLNSKQVSKTTDLHEYQVSHADDDDYEDLYLGDDDGFTADGEPIDKEVLRKYLKQVKKSQGFDIIDYPGFICGVTYIVPCIDDFDLDEAMGMAALAVTTYNEDHHKTEFKVVGVEKLNSELRGVYFDYYITFSAVEVKGCREHNKGSPVQHSFFSKLVLTIKQMIMPFLIWGTKGSGRKKLDFQELKNLIASEDDLDQTVACKTFQAVVCKQFVKREYEVSFCKVAGVSGNPLVPRSKSCACACGIY